VDLSVGRKIHRLLRSAGLVDIQVNPLLHVFPLGHPRRPIFWGFLRDLRNRILADGAISQEEFDELMVQMKNDLDDPHRLSLHLYFQAWGRKPA
jgi:hypothetical protein